MSGFGVGTTQPRVDSLKEILRAATTRPDTEQNTLFIAIDFGTTYTGVAYVFSSSPDVIYQITTWPSMPRTSTTSKVPTLLKYESGGGMRWGYEVSPTDPKRIEGFKQLLEPGLPKPLHVTYPKVQSELKAQRKDAFQVTHAYFKALYNYILPWIEDEHTDDFAGALSIKFILPFPADWSVNGKKIVKDAAGKAGFSPILETAKLEAAATYALSHENLRSAKLQLNDCFCICDAGGGLVDVMSYKLKKILPLDMELLVPATSSTGGSLMLDKAFEHYIQGVIDEEELMHLKKTPAYGSAIREFAEKVKPKYSFTGPTTYRIEFPGANLTPDASIGVEASGITLTRDNLKTIFQSVIKEISELIKAQVRSVELKFANKQNATLVKCIILIGGMGSNKHLKEYLAKDFPRLQIVQPEFAWTAVCRGSLMRHLPTKKETNTVSSPRTQVRMKKKAPKSYGIINGPIWSMEKHGDVPKFWDDWESVWRCQDITWFVSKGDDISRPRKIPMSFHKECPPYPKVGTACIKFEVRESPNSQALGIPFTSGASRRCTSINVPLMRIPETKFTKKIRKSDGEEYWDLEYKIVINIEDMVLTVWVDVDGARYGQTILR